MKAIVHEKYGSPDVLELREVETPAPKDNEVLLKIHAASANPSDLAGMSGPPFIFRLLFQMGLNKPKEPRLGSDVAGRVEAVGAGVTQFKPGDEVFGACRGSFAEYAIAREDRLSMKPANISFEQAAAVPIAAITALQGLRNKGNVQRGQKVLIQGASGGVGTFAVQIAKSFGAEVTAVCSTRNLDMARSIGADHDIDYTRDDFTRNEQHYDLILGVNGYHPILDYRRVLSPKGIYVMAGASWTRIFLALLEVLLLGPLISMAGTRKMVSMGIARINDKDLAFLAQLLENGRIVPVIDRRYPLSETAEAMRYLGGGHARAKVIITVT